jgi:hypothetical protein
MRRPTCPTDRAFSLLVRTHITLIVLVWAGGACDILAQVTAGSVAGAFRFVGQLAFALLATVPVAGSARLRGDGGVARRTSRRSLLPPVPRSLAKQHSSKLNPLRIIDIEHDERGPANRCTTTKRRAAPLKMPAPGLQAGVEEPHNFTGH